MADSGIWERICHLLSCSKETVEEVREKALERMKTQWIKLSAGHSFVVPSKQHPSLHPSWGSTWGWSGSPHFPQLASSLERRQSTKHLEEICWAEDSVNSCSYKDADLGYPMNHPLKVLWDFFLPSCNVEAHLPISPVTQGGV